MKRFPNIVLGLAFLLCLIIAGAQGARVNALRESESFYRWMDVLGVPVLLVLFGLLLWFLKGQLRKALAARYGG